MKFEFICVDFEQDKVIKQLKDSNFSVTINDDGCRYEHYCIDIDTIEELIGVVDILEEHFLLVTIYNHGVYPSINAVCLLP